MIKTCLWLRLLALKGTVVRLSKPFIDLEDCRYIFVFKLKSKLSLEVKLSLRTFELGSKLLNV